MDRSITDGEILAAIRELDPNSEAREFWVRSALVGELSRLGGSIICVRGSQEELEAALKALDYTLNTLPHLYNAWELEPAQAMRVRLREVLKASEPKPELTSEQGVLAELERINQRVLEVRRNPELARKWMERETRGLRQDLRACRGEEDDE